MEVYPSPSGTFLKMKLVTKDGDHGIINAKKMILEECSGETFNVNVTGTDGCHSGTFFDFTVHSSDGVVLHKTDKGWELLPTYMEA